MVVGRFWVVTGGPSLRQSLTPELRFPEAFASSSSSQPREGTIVREVRTLRERLAAMEDQGS
jgi:hypothetical protein